MFDRPRVDFERRFRLVVESVHHLIAALRADSNRAPKEVGALRQRADIIQDRTALPEAVVEDEIVVVAIVGGEGAEIL